MRNILVFPDGEEVHFQYPKDHIIEVGYPFEVTLKDDTKKHAIVQRIETSKVEPEIRYYLF